MPAAIAKIAVSAAPYWVDKPFDYLIPEEMREQAVPGVRVSVPFSLGNRRSEGIILAVTEHSEFTQLKAIIKVLDPQPVLTQEQIKLALFMRERFFCTVYEAVKAILPAGLWFNEEGTRRAKDKTVEVARLCGSSEEAAAIAASDDPVLHFLQAFTLREAALKRGDGNTLCRVMAQPPPPGFSRILYLPDGRRSVLSAVGEGPFALTECALPG